MDTGFVVSNGIERSPDGKTMYFTASRRQVMYAYVNDDITGAIEHRRSLIQLVPEDASLPDGLTDDSAGCIWSAHWGGWRIARYDPQGKKERELARQRDFSNTRFLACT
jgi:sugar lactone lactonase YvrE